MEDVLSLSLSQRAEPIPLSDREQSFLKTPVGILSKETRVFPTPKGAPLFVKRDM